MRRLFEEARSKIRGCVEKKDLKGQDERVEDGGRKQRFLEAQRKLGKVVQVEHERKKASVLRLEEAEEYRRSKVAEMASIFK